MRTFVPVVTGRGVVQLSNHLQVVLASFLAAGALSQLRYAQILYALPISPMVQLDRFAVTADGRACWATCRPSPRSTSRTAGR